ncbi:hypothetical conserved protein [Rhizobium etli CIAT 652]|uniref:Hypothetical conserved protein n=1 Tax=Rhizobium etli (strain CIAT 652) TaxID=491916 RepID=B3PRB5_RHIE6|nr:hypothetical conserved protein [Rhizobium etli CIAT 652]
MPAPISAIIATAIRASEPEPFETVYSGIAFPRSSDSENDRRARFIAARIYRNFCTNGNGFLRGVRIEILLPEMSASPRCLARMEPRSSIFGAFSWFRLTWREIDRRKTTIARTLRGEKYRQRRKPRKSLGRRHIRCAAQNRAQWNESFSDEAYGKEKGRPEGRPSCSGCRNECRLRLSHHVHSASSARLTR